MRAYEVLILSGADDPTADAVAVELERRDVRYGRLDTGDFPTRLRLAVDTRAGRWTGRLGGSDTDIDLSAIRSVYYRRPTRFRLPEGMSQADQVFAAAEARHAIGGLLASLDVLWVNDPMKKAAAEYKPLQLATAAAAGLRTPATLLTNHQPSAAEFAEAVGGSVVCKQMSSLTFVEDDHVDSLSYSPTEMPDDVRAGIGAFMDTLDLTFGAFDFVITPTGDWVMLECNPAGQWLWLEHETGVPIAAALASLLRRGSLR